MAIQVYVGNLSPQTTQGAIRRLLVSYGYITSVHLMADNAGRPWGSAFVTMDTMGPGKRLRLSTRRRWMARISQSTYGWFRHVWPVGLLVLIKAAAEGD